MIWSNWFLFKYVQVYIQKWSSIDSIILKKFHRFEKTLEQYNSPSSILFPPPGTHFEHYYQPQSYRQFFFLYKNSSLKCQGLLSAAKKEANVKTEKWIQFQAIIADLQGLWFPLSINFAQTRWKKNAASVFAADELHLCRFFHSKWWFRYTSLPHFTFQRFFPFFSPWYVCLWMPYMFIRFSNFFFPLSSKG